MARGQHDHARLAHLAGRNLGVFTRAQAIECGYSQKQVRTRVDRGDWQPVLGGALAPAGLAITPKVRDRAAQLSVPGSVLGGASAARIWQIDVPDDRTFLYVGPHGRTRLPDVVGLHCSPDRADLCLFRGLPTVEVACALTECLLWLPEREAVDLLDRTLQRRVWTFDEFSHRVESRRALRGFHRLRALRDLVAGGERAESERRFTTLLGEAGITGWRANVPISDDKGVIGIADVAFKRERLVVELDGWAYHSSPDRFQRDRDRQNRLIRAGWRVLRFTWRDLTQRPAHVVTEIRATLPRS